jgi:hypothetical protein
MLIPGSEQCSQLSFVLVAPSFRQFTAEIYSRKYRVQRRLPVPFVAVELFLHNYRVSVLQLSWRPEPAKIAGGWRVNIDLNSTAGGKWAFRSRLDLRRQYQA